MPQTEAQGGGLAEAAHVGPDALLDRLQRRPAVALLRNVPSDDVRGAVVHGREEPAPAPRLRPEPLRVRAPEFVRPLGSDPSAVAPVSAGMPPPHRRQQSVRSHQPEHPVLADSDPLGRKSCLDLPVPLAEERPGILLQTE